MKSKFLIPQSISLLLLLFIDSCTPPQPPPPPLPPSNTPPVIRLQNKQLTITIPPNHVLLKATATDDEHNIGSFLWKQLNGPTQAIISNPTTGNTSASSLSSGIYQFEFTVTDFKGLFDKDTMTLNALAPQTGREIIYQNQNWTCDWGCLINSLDISIIPANTPFLVYIKRDGSSDWVLVPTDQQISPGNLYSYFGNDRVIEVVLLEDRTGQDTPDIKIVF